DNSTVESVADKQVEVEPTTTAEDVADVDN
ncbi:hypothetical protein A2U01_0066993, partial [Trifolium medium]|nr:hypothetical protein [Trifolium medium]